MNVHLTFDVEIWCNGWHKLDERFPACFERYVYGGSPLGDYALPKTLEILSRHGLKGVFFVEPLFALRFGKHYLRELVGLIDRAGHDVQLHLHPEWVDEIEPKLITNVVPKRQYLWAFTLAEQIALISSAKRVLEQALGRPITVFRAGSYAANRDTYTALDRLGIKIDSSLNDCYAVSAPDVPRLAFYQSVQLVGSASCYQVTVFRDGFGRLRPMQINGCGFSELRDALLDAQRSGMRHCVVVSHNFEMLKPGLTDPDPIVVRRFEHFCAWLAINTEHFTVSGFPAVHEPTGPERVPRCGALATAQRHALQLLRRL